MPSSSPVRVLLANEPLQLDHVETDLFHHAPPYALEAVAGTLAQAGLAPRVLDLKSESHPRAALERAMEEFEPAVVGFSATKMVNAASIRGLIAFVRGRWPGVRLIAGGQTATFVPEAFLEGPNGEPGVDVVLLNEVDDTVVDVVLALAEGRDPGQVAGTVVRSAGELVRRPGAVSERSMDERVKPFRTHGLRSVIGDGDTAAIETIRGCHERCAHCPIPRFHHDKVRLRSVESVLDEMEALKREGISELMIIDQCFGVVPRHAKAIVRGMKERGLSFHLLILTRSGIGVEHPDLFEALHEVGLMGVLLFFDTNAGDVLGSRCARPSHRQEAAFARSLLARGVFVNGFTYVGAPGSTLWRDARAVVANGRLSDVHNPIMFTPFVGTAVHDALAAEGRLLTTELDAYDYTNYVVADGRHPKVLKGLLLLARLASFFDPFKPLRLLRHSSVARWRLVRRSYDSLARVFTRLREGNI